MLHLSSLRRIAPAAVLAAVLSMTVAAAAPASAGAAPAAPAAAAVTTFDPVTLQISADRVVTTAQHGRAVVSGTVRCSGPDASVGGIEVRLTQRRGFLRVAGSAYLDAPVCDGQVRTWTAPVRGEAGVFGGGRALVQVWAYVCGTGACANVVLEQDARVRR